MFELRTNILRNWAFVCFILFVIILVNAFGEAGREILAYQSGLFSTGEIWRAISGHFTHLGWPHLILNAVGLLGVWSLYGKRFNSVSWAIIFLICAFGISVGFAIFDKNLQTYVGLSGVLHGLLTAAAVNSLVLSRDIENELPIEDIVVLACLGLKIAYEQFIGSVPLTASLSGGSVVVNAHLYGAVLGIIAGGGISLFARIRHYKSLLSNDV